MTVYLCKESFEGILCGVYDAWMSRRGHDNVRLELEDSSNMELFCEYRNVEIIPEKANQVIESIKTKISLHAYEYVYKASLGCDEKRADKIYRFLIYGFHVGAGILDMLHIPAVYNIFEICRYVGNETHLLHGFVRFTEMEKGLLVSKIAPRNDVLELLAPHFTDRLSGENWIIYDKNRGKAVLHPAQSKWLVIHLSSDEWRDKMDYSILEDEYQDLWKIFHSSISISERENPACQRNHLPLRYRTDMTEF